MRCDYVNTEYDIAQFIVRAPYLWGTTLQMAMLTNSVSQQESVITA